MNNDPVFPAGAYYITDLCYTSLGEDHWDEFCNNLVPGEFTFENGIRVWWDFTAYGDGCYQDQYGNDYSVDAGLIGIVSCDDVNWKYPDQIGNLGQKVIFNKPFKVSCDDGVFHFGHIVINTRDDNDEYDEYDEYYE